MGKQDICYKSNLDNYRVTYHQFSIEGKFHVDRYVLFQCENGTFNSIWETIYWTDSLPEAINIVKKSKDVPILHRYNEVWC